MKTKIANLDTEIKYAVPKKTIVFIYNMANEIRSGKVSYNKDKVKMLEQLRDDTIGKANSIMFAIHGLDDFFPSPLSEPSAPHK